MRHSSPRISENARKRVEHFKDINLENLNSIETFFRFTKFRYISNARTWPNS